MRNLKEFLFGKWEVIETCPMTMSREKEGQIEGSLIIWENSRTRKQMSRVEFLDGYKQDISPELAHSVIERYREKYPK